ncbi:hypothetical protein [Glutamicibacter soli]|uniref:hypothetical protein n=1 Tax=Glutamicibacter soli TaxID=453836 RepID=UPI003FD27EFF
MHYDEPGLFNLPDQTPAPVAFEDPLVKEQQVASIRRAFDDAGITSMEERQELIQSCTARPVANIRELYMRDVRQVLKRIEDRKNYMGPSTGSAWDNREEETWIDKL